jgi:hypothetical protein
MGVISHPTYILDFMRKSMLPLKKLYIFVSHFLKRVGPNKRAKKKGRPRKYEDALMKMSTFGIHRVG